MSKLACVFRFWSLLFRSRVSRVVATSLWIAAWAFLFATVTARADDAYVEGGSGVVRALRGHPAIRMVSEEVDITVPAGKVTAKFVFRNEGPATEVIIGFPEEGKDGTERTHMKGFRSA